MKRFAAACLVAVCLAGCDDTARETTQVVVLVETDLSADRELERVRARVLDDGTGKLRSESEFQVGSSNPREERTELPFSFGVAKASAGSFLLQVSGFAPDSSEVAVQYETRIVFAPGKTLLVRVFLAEACRGRSCDPGETCYPDPRGATAGGECGELPLAQGRVIEPGAELSLGRDAAVRPAADGGEDAAAGNGLDAGDDAGQQGAPGGSGAGTAGMPAAGRSAAAGSGGSSGGPNLDEDAGTDSLNQVVEEELAGFIVEMNIAIETMCDCYQAFAYSSKRECANALGGKIVPGRHTCMSAAVQRAPSESLPALRCKRAGFRSYSDCLAVKFQCPSPIGGQECLSTLNLGLQRCTGYPAEVKPRIEACNEQSARFASYFDAIRTPVERVCRCHMALGYPELEACDKTEGIAELEYERLESCFFDMNGKPGVPAGTTVSVANYYSCDAANMDAYKDCMDPVPLCMGTGPIDCRNAYRIERAACLDAAHFVVDPYTLCGE